MTWTELHEACEGQNTEKVIQLVSQKPESALQVDDHGSTPLHIICWNNPDTKAVHALLQACPQAVSGQDNNGDTPLHIACSCPKTDKHLVQMLLDACPTAASIPNQEGLMPLHVACRDSPHNEGLLGLLIETYPYALRSHIKMGSPAPGARKTYLVGKETDHALIDPSAGMATKDSVDLRFRGTSEQIRDGAYPLHMAVEAGASVGVLEMLIKEADDILLKTNKFGETPLHLALKKAGNDDVVEVMLRCAPKAVHVRDKKHGDLPIHTAAMAGCSVHVAKDLLEIWPEAIHEVNVEGFTPMELAIQNGKTAEEVLRLLAISDHTA